MGAAQTISKKTVSRKASGTRRSASGETIDLRALNRATLARQMLLEREAETIPQAVRRLAGLQAQLPWPPYVGLWSRLADFQRAQLARLIDDRAIVRATLMRGTLHLAAADDFLHWRVLMQPMLSRALQSMPKERTRGIDPEAMRAVGRACLEDGPKTFNEIRDVLAAKFPKLDVRMMGYAVRMTLPLVQVPGPGAWGFPAEPAFALAEKWLDRPLANDADPRPLIRRYLAAFGPANASDVQTWSGLAGLREIMDGMRAELLVLRGENGRELFDLPDAPRPSGDVAAPPRFLPDFDNLLLAHADRSRVIPDAFRSKVFLPGLRVAATFLVDGFVRGAWKIERKKKAVTLVLTAFAPLTKKEKQALEEEGERLAQFIEPDAATHSVRFAKA